MGDSVDLQVTSWTDRQQVCGAFFVEPGVSQVMHLAGFSNVASFTDPVASVEDHIPNAFPVPLARFRARLLCWR
jgi:hypothetical protein